MEISRVDTNLPENREIGLTPPIQACVSYSMSEPLYLLSEVCDFGVNIVNNNGYTALHYTESCGKDYGDTQLHKACQKGDMTEVMRLVNLCDHVIM